MEHRPRTLTRSIDRTIGGVAAGVAEYIGVDPTIVRALWVVGAVFAPPFAVLGYLLLWVIMPASTAAPLAPAARRGSSSGTDTALLLGIVLLGVGLVLLSGQLGWLRWLGWGITRLLWPMLLVVAGAYLLTRRRADT